MPFSSIAQLHKFFALEKEGKLPMGTARKWLEETKVSKLPLRKKKK